MNPYNRLAEKMGKFSNETCYQVKLLKEDI